MGTNNATGEIIEQIKKEMRNKNVTLRDLSEMSMVASSTIYDVFENRGSPRLSTIIYLCKALGLEIKVCKGKSNSESDELMELISNLSEKKRKKIKEMVLILEKYNE